MASGKRRADVLVERWKAIFRKYDAVGSGTLRMEDVKRMIRRDLQISERLVSDEQFREVFSLIDGDGGGAVEFNEFLDFVQTKSARKSKVPEEDVVNAVARAVRLALHRNKTNILELEQKFQNFDATIGDVSTGELGPEDMRRFFRNQLLVTKHECSDKNLRVAFYAMDDDGSGTMSADEFMEFIKFCCKEDKDKEIPLRVQGLLGGTRGQLPKRPPMQRPGTDSGSPMSSMPFCLNGRDISMTSRMGASIVSWPLTQSRSYPGLRTMNELKGVNRMQSTARSADANSDGSQPSSPTLASVGSLSPSDLQRSASATAGEFYACPRGEKCPFAHGDIRSWGGRYRADTPTSPFGGSATPMSATSGGGGFGATSEKARARSCGTGSDRASRPTGRYATIKGAEALNRVESRLLESGIDVRGHYNRLR